MLTKLVRISARIPWQVICSRQITNHTSKRTLPVTFNINKPQAFSGNSISGIRSFSDQVKLDKSQIEEKILEIIKNFDRVKENPANPQIEMETNLMKDLGLDSLDQVEIIVQLEDAFGYEIPDSDYEKLNTPAEIASYIQKRLTDV